MPHLLNLSWQREKRLESRYSITRPVVKPTLR